MMDAIVDASIYVTDAIYNLSLRKWKKRTILFSLCKLIESSDRSLQTSIGLNEVPHAYYVNVLRRKQRVSEWIVNASPGTVSFTYDWRQMLIRLR